MALTSMIDFPLYSIPSQGPKWEPVRPLGKSRPAGRQRMAPSDGSQRDRAMRRSAKARWDAVWNKALAAEPLVAPDRRAFYRAQLLTMIAINRESNRTLLEVSKAIQDADRGQIAEARQATSLALHALGAVRQAQVSAEYGKWKNWYRGDWLTGVYQTQQVVQTFAAFLNDPLTQFQPPIVWSNWEAYYHIMHYEGDRSVDVH